MTPSASHVLLRGLASLPLLTAAAPCSVLASEGGASLNVVVNAPYGRAVNSERVPTSVQTATVDDIEKFAPLDLTALLNRAFAGVSINHAQNNPLQTDLHFRGYAASPLLGLPQGLSVYQNGVRINEPFGDTISWDLLPLSAIDSVQVMGGANPVFGLNTLGGAISLRTKDGFSYDGAELQVQTGSFGRRTASLQRGDHGKSVAHYANIDYFEEEGWRDYSASHALRVLSVTSLRGAQDAELNLTFALSESQLRGNGATPAELLEIRRASVFTHPDITENRHLQLIVEGSLPLGPALLSGNAHYGRLRTDNFNGDGSPFDTCQSAGQLILVEEDFIDADADGECSTAIDDDVQVLRDTRGDLIPAMLNGEALNAINNISDRVQESYGASLQVSLGGELAGKTHELMVGTAIRRAHTQFHSVTELARLLENRSTSRTGIFADTLRTQVRSDVSVASAYLMNTWSVARDVAVTLSGRYDRTQIDLSDRSGTSPELNGTHSFARFNPALGITAQLTSAMTLFTSIGESTRTPTPVELACADAQAPCNLPNAFLADPPLNQVVSRTAEIGVRSRTAQQLSWQLSAFQATNRDDIVFQSTGGAQANVGFFANIGQTRRRGLELSVQQQLGRMHCFAAYSLTTATFEDGFQVNSPHHPAVDSGEAGTLAVPRGSIIPGIPEHRLNVGADLDLSARVSVGFDLSAGTGVYLRGDEANLLPKTDDYLIANLRADWRISDAATLYVRVENVFDRHYETFGLLGEPDEVLPGSEDPRFLGAAPPRGAWIGVRVKM